MLFYLSSTLFLYVLLGLSRSVLSAPVAASSIETEARNKTSPAFVIYSNKFVSSSVLPPVSELKVSIFDCLPDFVRLNTHLTAF